MSPFKVVRCRYFDDRGRPIKPYCSQGDRCSFIHPNDSTWDTAPPSRKPADSTDSYRQRRSGAQATPKPSNQRRQSPLAPQSDLFKKNTGGVDARHPRDDREHRGGEWDAKTRRSGLSNHDYMKSEDRSGSLWSGKRKTSSYDAPTRDNDSDPYSRSDGRGRNYKQNGNNLTYLSGRSIIDREDTFEDPPSSGLPFDVPTEQGCLAPSNDTQHVLGGRTFADKIIESFREVAKITNRAVQDSAACDREEEKLRTYSDLSSALAKVSPLATSAVAPTLATVTVNHAKYRERAQSEFKRLGHVWEDILELLVKGVFHAVDSELESTIRALKVKAQVSTPHTDACADRAGVDTSSYPRLSRSIRKRKADESRPLSTKPVFVRSGSPEFSNGYKRRRLCDVQRDESCDGLRQPVSDLPFSVVDPDLLSMVEDMKSRINSQADALKRLTEENARLKLTLDNQSVNSSSEAGSFLESGVLYLSSQASAEIY